MKATKQSGICSRQSRRQLLVWAAAAGLGALWMPAWSQQDYPIKPVRLVVPFAPGGAADVGARTIAEQLGRKLGQQVIVENKPGAGGNIGAQYVALSQPDGYTLLLAYDGTMVINPHVYAKVPFDTLKDFAPVGKIGDIGLLIVANPKLGAKNLHEVVSLSKSHAGGLSVGTTGTGSTAHLLVELIKQRTGANLVHIPYKGAGPALVDVMGGQTPLAIVGVVGVPQHIIAGTIQAIAISSARRSKLLPNVPTVVESGYTDLVFNSWNGIVAPSKTPRPIIERLNSELNAALTDPSVRERLEAIGFDSVAGTPTSFGEQIRGDLARYGQVVKGAAMKAE